MIEFYRVNAARLKGRESDAMLRKCMGVTGLSNQDQRLENRCGEMVENFASGRTGKMGRWLNWGTAVLGSWSNYAV
jgi:hypothetical protein